ncbi:MAG: MBL fold metallo-hydrolase [Myxococcales bacterium]|nr:MBL fold metallo-hydrolase [Myxococcales bacterium]
MKIRFWGVRGSCATPGGRYLRYGGNTTAIEVRSDSGHRILIDLGTGVTELAKELMAAEFGQGKGVLPVLLTHTHVDHIQGLPFFTPLFIRGNSIRIMGRELAGVSLKEVLQDQLNGHYSPLYGLENLAAGLEVQTLKTGASWPAEGFEVKTELAPHGSTSVVACRITADGKSVVIMTDVEHAPEGISPELTELARDCDLLVHDAMFSDSEYAQRAGWGHSSVGSAIAVAESVGARRLALFHHSPDSSDEHLDMIVGQATESSSVAVFAAQEGHDVDI